MVAAVIFSTYVSLGGLWGTAVTNLIHCSVVLVGLLWVGLMGIDRLGGWDGVTESIGVHLAAASGDETAWWGFAGAGWLPVIGMFFAAAVHTPAASVYTNYSTAARTERQIAPAFLLGGLIAAAMSVLAGLIGILTTARYGLDTGLGGYRNLTILASGIDPVVGGAALAAVLAAVISSGGPILLSSATMVVRDWLPFSCRRTSEQQLRAYRITTTVYAFAAALAAWFVATRTTISILDLLLFGFAMVVPPAVALGYLIYRPRTTEQGAWWGMASGYGAGLVWFASIKVALAAGVTVPESSGFVVRILAHALTVDGEGLDPSYLTFFVPLAVIPLVSRFTSDTGARDDFYEILSGRRPVAVETDR